MVGVLQHDMHDLVDVVVKWFLVTQPTCLMNTLYGIGVIILLWLVREEQIWCIGGVVYVTVRYVYKVGCS